MSPEAARGERVALRVCNDCHQVGPTHPSTSEDVGPSFIAIASQPGRDRAGLTQFLGDLHGLGALNLPAISMPTYILSRDERDDLVAYILTFRKAP